MPPAVVPMAYWYPLMPLSASVLASQLADNCVVEVVVAMSAPVPSRTASGGLGGVGVHDPLAVGIRSVAGQSGAVDGLHAEEVGLADNERQAGLRHGGDVAQ